MATEYYDSVYEAGLKKHFGDRLNVLSHELTEDGIKNMYDDFASEYDKSVQKAGGVWYKPLAEYLDTSLKDVFQHKTKNEIKIIDAGAGTGNVGVELHKLGYTDLHALDISQEMLNEAKKKNVYNKFICTSLTDQRIPEINTGEYDALICAGTLATGHVRSSAFEEMIRMVKIGGVLCFNIREGHLADYQAKMSDLEKAGRWENLSKIKLPYFEGEGLPRETFVFLFKVLRN